MEESGLHRSASNGSRNVEAGLSGVRHTRISAAPLEDAEGKHAPGEAPVLACPAVSPPGERKRADDPRLIGRGGALDGGAHQEAKTAAARSQVRGTSREPFAIGCDPIGKGESRGTQHSIGRRNQATKPIRRLVPPVKTANGCET
jgi:hypothetical protein